VPKQGGVVRVNLFHPRVTTPFRENYGPEQESERLAFPGAGCAEIPRRTPREDAKYRPGKTGWSLHKKLLWAVRVPVLLGSFQPPRAPLRPTPPLRRQLPVEGVGRMMWGISSGGGTEQRPLGRCPPPGDGTTPRNPPGGVVLLHSLRRGRRGYLSRGASPVLFLTLRGSRPGCSPAKFKHISQRRKRNQSRFP
jgi:hypothetical protein